MVDGAGPYAKETWVPGGPPGISATRLNKFEQGLAWLLNNSFTDAERDALAGADLWAGRVIFNLPSGVLQMFDGSSWGDVGIPAELFYMGGM